MKKYGVHETNKPESTKEASEGHRVTRCPKCNSKLEVAGQVLLCPTHGSEPFETESSKH